MLGRLLRNRRAGEAKLLWHRPELHAPDDLRLSSADFEHEGAMPPDSAATRVGGRDVSPALSWQQAPAQTAALLLVMADVDVPLRSPITHLAALLDPTLTELARGALHQRTAAEGVQLFKTILGTGYHGPAPIKGHGPHRYVTQLFALAGRVSAGEPTTLDAVLAATDGVLARSRLDGFYERG